MDGYAVRRRDVAGAARDRPALLPVSLDIPAGAPLPPPAEIRIFKIPALGDNIRLAGQEVRAGQVVLEVGQALSPAAIGLLAALGQAQVSVYRRPLVAILSTGDEWCAVAASPAPGQLRDANSYALAAAVERGGGQALRLGIAPDRVAEARACLRAAGAHLILSSAGVSVGAHDVVREAMSAAGKLDFWRVRGNELVAYSAGDQGSASLATLVRADGPGYYS